MDDETDGAGNINWSNVPQNVRIINYPFYDRYRKELYLLGGLFVFSFLLISCLAGIFTACDDIEDEYITDTQLSILQESRTSLNYLLKNSTYGTAPGTYPETGKDILNAAIAELDALITRVEAGEELDETTLETGILKSRHCRGRRKGTR